LTLSRPQRPFPPSPVGSLLKRASVPTTIARPSNHGDADYLALIRSLPCLHCGLDPCYEAAHLRLSSAAYGKVSGLGKRPADSWCLPLCPEHHRLNRNAQHNQGERQFWEALGINPLATCVALYAQAGDMVAMRAIIFLTIAQRGKPQCL
jgi:hypothetical protein